MKHLILSISTLAICYVTSAQTFGLQAGVNIASQSIGSEETAGFTISTSSKTGFLIGVVGQFPLSKVIAFRPELNYIQKGSETTGETADEFVIIALNYIDLPLNFVFSSDAGKGKFFFGAGPSIGYGLSGHTKLKTGGQEISQDIKFDGKSADAENDGYGHLKALDLGFNLLGGYTFSNGFFANTGYSFGLSNITPEEGSRLKNKGFFIKVGYCFSNSAKAAKK